MSSDEPWANDASASMVVVSGRGKPEQPLQEDVDRGGVEEVLAADDRSHSLERVVDYDRQGRVAGRSSRRLCIRN